MLILAGILLFVNILYLLCGLCFLNRLLLLKGALLCSVGDLFGRKVGLVRRILSVFCLPCKLLVTVLLWPLFIAQYKRLYKALRMQLIR